MASTDGTTRGRSDAIATGAVPPSTTKDLGDLVKRKLDELGITAAVILDDEYAPGMPKDRWSEVAEIVRDRDTALFETIERIVDKSGSGKVDDYPTDAAMASIIAAIGGSSCREAQDLLVQKSPHALVTLETYLRELGREVKTYWSVEHVPLNEKLYFVDYRMQPDPVTHGADASHLLERIVTQCSEGEPPPGAVLMSRIQDERPLPTDVEVIARRGGGFVRTNLRYLDKAQMLPSKNRFLFLLYDLLESLPLGGKYFAQVQTLRKAASATLDNVAQEVCSLLPADFQLFAHAVAGSGDDQRSRMGEHLLMLFTGLLAVELRNDKNTQGSLGQFFDMLMKGSGMAPGEIGSHSLHRLHSRLLYDQSDWVKKAPTAFGDIFQCSRDKKTYYIVVTPECDLELRSKSGAAPAPKVPFVTLLRGELRSDRPPEKERDNEVVTPLIVDPDTDSVSWMYWKLQAPSIVPWERLVVGSTRFTKWGRLRLQEAEKIQMRYATDLLAVGTEDIPDRVEKRKAVLWEVDASKKAKQSKELFAFSIMEIVNPKDHDDIYWALAPGCEHLLTGDTNTIIPAQLVAQLRSYQRKDKFVEELRPHKIRLAPPNEPKPKLATKGAEKPQPPICADPAPTEQSAEATGLAPDAVSPETVVNPPAMPQDEGKPDLNFGWFVSKSCPNKWDGPVRQPATPQQLEG